MNASANNVKPTHKPVAFQARMGCAEYLLAQGREALHDKLWTRLIRTTVVLFLISIAWNMCYFYL